MITAHSGSDGTQENSEAYIDYCIAGALDCFEVDVRLKHGNFYLNHEPVDDETCCVGLSLVFEKIKDMPILVNCDLKEPNLESSVLKMAEAMQVSDQLIFSGDVNIANIPNSFRAQVFYNAENYAKTHPEVLQFEAAALEAMFTNLANQGITTLNLYAPLLSRDLLELAHAHGMAVCVWTLHDVQDIAAYQALGADHITTTCAAQWKRQGFRHA